MSRIPEAFAHGKAFVAFITCGDPDLQTTEEAVLAAAENGADLIELGIPFSDPTAEGPVIQAANMRARSGGVTTDRILDFAASLRQRTSGSACSRSSHPPCRKHLLSDKSPCTAGCRD